MEISKDGKWEGTVLDLIHLQTSVLTLESAHRLVRILFSQLPALLTVTS
jgi:hypothetical protein